MMRRLRALLGPLIGAWLLCHAATLAVVPVLLCVAGAETMPVECTCDHGDHSLCPMHHKRTSRPGVCVMQGAGGDGTAVLTSLLGQLGLIPSASPLAAPDGGTPYAASAVTTSSLRPSPPDPPPPRA
jgi:hypothetical protein